MSTMILSLCGLSYLVGMLSGLVLSLALHKKGHRL